MDRKRGYKNYNTNLPNNGDRMKAYVKSITSIDTKDLNLPIGSYIGEVVKITNESYLIKLDKKFKVVTGMQIAQKLHIT